ncbi:MAG: DUF1015 domain-containing protein [Bacteroidota bacterium]
MARIRPFRAWRYDPEEVSDINQKFSPLFDVVSPEQLAQLYDIPNNSIHLAVPRSDEEALAKLAAWKTTGVIRQDPLPAIYIYYQEFSLYGEARRYTRKGFVAMIRVDDESGTPTSDIVLHEDTISSSVAERTRHLEKTLLNTAPTHGLYDDPDFSLEPLMDRYMEHPLYEYIDYQGVINKLAIVQDRQDILRFQALLGERKVYLADGHHRLASSVALRRKSHASGPKLPPDSFRDYHLMYLTNLQSDDLRILPIHRVISLDKKTYNPNPILQALRAYFTITDITFDRVPVYERVRNQRYAFGMVLGTTQFLLELKPEIDPVVGIALDLPEAVRSLDYTVLHYFVFDRGFGIPYAEQPRNDSISYIKDYGLAVKAAVTHADRVAFIMPDTSMAQMMEVCASGALMPQKSTYFYPKVVCGLVFASIDDNENNSSFDISFRLPPAATPAP